MEATEKNAMQPTIQQIPSPMSQHPVSPPPQFMHQDGMSPSQMSPYHQQPQMTYNPNGQQPTYFNQQLGMPQQQGSPGQWQQVTTPPQGQMQQPQQRQYMNAVAIGNLGMGASPCDCPMCGQRTMTNISYHAGNTTHVWAGITCLLTGFLCFIPYMMNSLKDVQHRCGSCGTLLATWHKSGQTEAHTHA